MEPFFRIVLSSTETTQHYHFMTYNVGSDLAK